MRIHTLFLRTLKPVVVTAVVMLACQQSALAEQSTTVQKSTVVGKSTNERQTVAQPKIAVTDLSYDEIVKEHFESYEYSASIAATARPVTATKIRMIRHQTDHPTIAVPAVKNP